MADAGGSTGEGTTAERDVRRIRTRQIQESQTHQARASRASGEGEAGQASVELVAMVPAMLLAGLLLFQLVATGYTVTLVDGAAEAGALALASGNQAAPAVRDALPGWARDRVDVAAGRNRVDVAVAPPSPLRAIADRLQVSSSAAIGRVP